MERFREDSRLRHKWCSSLGRVKMPFEIECAEEGADRRRKTLRPPTETSRCPKQAQGRAGGTPGLPEGHPGRAPASAMARCSDATSRLRHEPKGNSPRQRRNRTRWHHNFGDVTAKMAEDAEGQKSPRGGSPQRAFGRPIARQGTPGRGCLPPHRRRVLGPRPLDT